MKKITLRVELGPLGKQGCTSFWELEIVAEPGAERIAAVRSAMDEIMALVVKELGPRQ